MNGFETLRISVHQREADAGLGPQKSNQWASWDRNWLEECGADTTVKMPSDDNRVMWDCPNVCFPCLMNTLRAQKAKRKPEPPG